MLKHIKGLVCVSLCASGHGHAHSTAAFALFNFCPLLNFLKAQNKREAGFISLIGMSPVTAASENIRQGKVWSEQAMAGRSNQKHSDAQFVAHETAERLSAQRD